jgi:acyl carrier protein
MEQVVFNILSTVLSNNDLATKEVYDPELRMREDLGMDSIMLAEMTVRIEDECGVDVFEGGMVYTVGQILDIVNMKTDT